MTRACSDSFGSDLHRPNVFCIFYWYIASCGSSEKCEKQKKKRRNAPQGSNKARMLKNGAAGGGQMYLGANYVDFADFDRNEQSPQKGIHFRLNKVPGMKSVECIIKEVLEEGKTW